MIKLFRVKMSQQAYSFLVVIVLVLLCINTSGFLSSVNPKGISKLLNRPFPTLSPKRALYLTWQTKLNAAKSPAEFDFSKVHKGMEEKMLKCIEALQSKFTTIRTNGANPAMLDRIMIDLYGVPTPLNQCARVAASGPLQLVIDPFDKNILKEIELAITNANLGLNPVVDGSGIIRIAIPPLTEDRRKELAKQSKAIAEEAKVAVRNVRRDFMEKIKSAEKDKSIGKDESKTHQDDLQKVTDDMIKKIDNLAKTKENDLLKM